MKPNPCATDVPTREIRVNRLKRALPASLSDLRLQFPASYDGPINSAAERRLYRDLRTAGATRTGIGEYA